MFLTQTTRPEIDALTQQIKQADEDIAGLRDLLNRPTKCTKASIDKFIKALSKYDAYNIPAAPIAKTVRMVVHSTSDHAVQGDKLITLINNLAAKHNVSTDLVEVYSYGCKIFKEQPEDPKIIFQRHRDLLKNHTEKLISEHDKCRKSLLKQHEKLVPPPAVQFVTKHGKWDSYILTTSAAPFVLTGNINAVMGLLKTLSLTQLKDTLIIVSNKGSRPEHSYTYDESLGWVEKAL